MPIIDNPVLYEKAKKIIYKQYLKPSAYRSGALVKLYKEMGGTYSGKKTNTGLTNWFKAEWADIGNGDYPVYRPTKRINKSTPLTASEIDPVQLKKQIKLKQKIKGTKNLPPFIKRGGKLRANDIQKILEASYEEEPPEKIGDWDLDKDLSTPYAKVYYNSNTNQAVVAHRGTQGTLDWGNNLAYALNPNPFSKNDYYDYTSRYNEGKKTQNEAESKYGANNISTLGHSQGAILSRKLGANTKEIINVNPAYKGEIPLKNEYNIRSSGDVVSAIYSPVSAISEYHYPSYTKEHSKTIPTENYLDVLGNHKHKILDSLGDKYIGEGSIGAGFNSREISKLSY